MMRYALIFTPFLLFSTIVLFGSDGEVMKSEEVLKSKNNVEKLKDIVFNVIHEQQIKISPFDYTASYIANNIVLKQKVPWQARTTEEWTTFGMIISPGKGYVKDTALLFDAMELNHQVAAIIEKIQKED